MPNRQMAYFFGCGTGISGEKWEVLRFLKQGAHSSI